MTEVRRATESDASALVELLGWLPVQSRIIQTSAEGELQVNAARLKDEQWCTLVAIDRESFQVLGAAVGCDSRYLDTPPSNAGNAPSAMLEDLVVHSDHEGKGIGKSLVRAFEEWARRRGCARVALSGGPSPVFYERCGYRRHGPFYHFVKDL